LRLIVVPAGPVAAIIASLEKPALPGRKPI
jgi:hypothetical protein